jgi:GTP-binding protein
MQDEGEDGDVEYMDADELEDVEDLEDFEYDDDATL